ncbi:helix-turn-helix transcriptional regulator [Dongia sp.]|uniref:helix-turn-helix transcriptional regulator n=1 Tax=Dongia sp. TaxID=1977262 RepID=UPI0035B013BC
MREDRGLNPSQFAKLTGLTRQAVANLEQGSVTPTISTLEKVGDAIGLAVTDVISMGAVTNKPINPKILSLVGLLRTLDGRSLELALSLVTALAEHRPK